MASKFSTKKLKQARLPFSPVGPQTAKKRKISNEGDEESKPSKLSCSDETTSSEMYSDSEIKPSDLSDSCITEVSESSVFSDEKENIGKIGHANTIVKNTESLTLKDEVSMDGIEILFVKSDEEKEEGKSSNYLVPTEKNNCEEEDNTNFSSDNKCKYDMAQKADHKTNAAIPVASNKTIQADQKCVQSNSLKELFKKMEGKHCLKSPNVSCISDKDVTADISVLNSKSSKNHPTEKNDSLKVSNDNDPELKSNKHCLRDEILISHASTNAIDVNESDCSSSDNLLLSNKDDSSQTSGSLQTPLRNHSVANSKKKLTPSQKLKQEQMFKMKLERMKLLEKKKKEKEWAQEEKQKEKEQKLETRNKQKEEMRILKEKEKQRKEEERVKKLEEKKKLEEERHKKDQEKKRKREEERRKEEEKKRKKEEVKLAEEEEKEKLKAKFAQFFVQKVVDTLPTNSPTCDMEASGGKFSLFQVKGNMRMAPVTRRCFSLEEKENFEATLTPRTKDFSSASYLRELENESFVIRASHRTFPVPEECDDDDDCEILSDDDDDEVAISTEAISCDNPVPRRRRAKFLQFCENRRPAYYGTWKKKSTLVNGRNPFGKDEKYFDYDYDSDDDWEEIENGESLSDSDGDAEEVPDDEVNQYEVDNDFFVPHGYLSDGEGEDEDGGIEGKQDLSQEQMSNERNEDIQNEKLKQKQEEFEMEMKQKTKQQKPRVFGCVWLGDANSHSAYDQLKKILSNHQVKVVFGVCPISVRSKENCGAVSPSLPDDDDSNTKFAKTFPEQAVPDLIRMLHGNKLSRLFLMREFHEYWKKKCAEDTKTPSSGALAMRKVSNKIQEIGRYERVVINGTPQKKCWNVSQDLRVKYGLSDLTFKNNWQYILNPKTRRSLEGKEDQLDESLTETPSPKQPPAKSLITNFTKILDDDEKRKLSSPISDATRNSKVRVDSQTKASDISSPIDKVGPCSISASAAAKLKKHSIPPSSTPTPRDRNRRKNPNVHSIKDLFKKSSCPLKDSSQPKEPAKENETECIVLD